MPLIGHNYIVTLYYPYLYLYSGLLVIRSFHAMAAPLIEGYHFF